MKYNFIADRETARMLTKESKKNGFYFRTLSRTDNVDRVPCEVTEPGHQYMTNTTIKIGYKYDVIDDDLGDVIEANQIEMTCDENMNYIISINDYVKLQEVAPAAMDDFDVIND